ncbi:hypothetical protein GCM10009424_21210 [Sphingomonas ursincola]|uniref:PqqD family protein n=1 Tax=Sphingomonas ursincola TaxID=56361 RepID=A0A7V8U7Y8_9SPHN|nr:PqqD family protein [Sphingomonas ursincola]MBA1373912.1 PqqD family protein [Sphingomonas ursincola]
MTDDISQNALFRPADKVVACDLGDGKALLNLTTNRYFRLNESGKVAWAAIEQGATRDDIVNKIMERFEVDVDRCVADVIAILNAFSKAGLVEIEVREVR